VRNIGEDLLDRLTRLEEQQRKSDQCSRLEKECNRGNDYEHRQVRFLVHSFIGLSFAACVAGPELTLGWTS
jgi:hypothetical protein